MKAKFLFGLLIVSGFIYSCTKPTSVNNSAGGALPTHYIKILNDSFSPRQLTVAVGSSITFVNNTNDAHTIISDDSSFLITPAIQPSTSFYFKKDTVATIGYHCHEHPSVRGTITFRP